MKRKNYIDQVTDLARRIEKMTGWERTHILEDTLDDFAIKHGGYDDAAYDVLIMAAEEREKAKLLKADPEFFFLTEDVARPNSGDVDAMIREYNAHIMDCLDVAMLLMNA